MIGILGLGTYLPPETRTNAWWPPEVVAAWTGARANSAPRLPDDASEGVRRVVAAMIAEAPDPFQGTRERRVSAETQSVLDMEEHAARRAIEQAAIDPQRIDLLLTHTVVPDVLLSNPACVLHRRLGLAHACMSMQVDTVMYSFLSQLALAEGMIAAGRATVALLVQSCISTRLIDREDPNSVLVGDGASAVVVGEVTGDRGILGSVHFTDGRFPHSLVMSVRGGRWFDPGRPRMHVAEPRQLQELFLSTADVCKHSVDAVLAKTGHAKEEIDFASLHQGTSWMQRVIHDHIGIGAVRSTETFTRFAHMMAAMIPTNLSYAAQEGQLLDDDLVVLAGGGTGTTYGATLIRWGR